MKTKLSLAVASALLAAASSANAAGGIVAGDWTIDIGGVVNAFYIVADNKDSNTITGGIAGVQDANEETNASSINAGLLPNFLTISGKTRSDDLDVSFLISSSPGSSSNEVTGAGATNSAAIIEHRQAFLTFGDKSWGTIKVGKDLGIFGSDAILSDMTLLGVGSGAGRGGVTTTLGRIGTGYQYAAWKGQISYASPSMNGLSFNVGVMHPGQGAPEVYQDSPVFEGKVTYDFAGDVSGRVWGGFITQRVQTTEATVDYSANNFELGAKAAFSGLELVAYGYSGKGAGTTFWLTNGVNEDGARRDSDGGYVQATYTLPTKTKVGASWGVSNLDTAGDEDGAGLVSKNEMWTVGVYHPIAKGLSLVAEYSNVQSESHDGLENESDIGSVGAILFF